MDINGFQFIGGAAVLGVVASFWSKIKVVLSRITSLFIVTVRIDGVIAEAISIYCWKELKRSPYGIRDFETSNIYIRPRKKSAYAIIEGISSDSIIFWKGWKPLLFKGMTSAGGEKSGEDRSPSLSFIRHTWNIEKLLFKCVENYNDEKNDINKNNNRRRFYIRHFFGLLGKESGQMEGNDDKTAEDNKEQSIRIGSYKIIGLNPNDIGYITKTKKPYISYLAFPQEVINLILEIKRWKESESWYEEKCIPWKRGWLLYGIAGTGKTSLVRAIAEYLDLPLYVFDLSTMTNEDLIQKWKRMLGSTPCIALFEDLDNVFNGRENVNKNTTRSVLSFDCLLNVMDGVEKSDGVFTVITTNRIDKLDKAIGIPRDDIKSNGTFISTRPGRIDRVMELKIMDEDCRRKISDRILAECTIEEKEEIIQKGKGDTGAQFQERCSHIALKYYWKNKDKENEKLDFEKPLYDDKYDNSDEKDMECDDEPIPEEDEEDGKNYR